MSTIEQTTPELKFGPIGHDVYRRTYSRPLPTGGSETWYDTVQRVVRGNTTLDPAIDPAEVSALTGLMDRFALMPAGRHLWVTGVDGIPGEGRRNCWRAPFSARLADHFEFLGSMLLIGGGVGANYSECYLAKTAPVRPISLTITCDRDHPDYDEVRRAAGDRFVDGIVGISVPDSREGWVWAWGHLFDAATGHVPTQVVIFDVSEVRPAGSPILTFGGTASGPAPLVSSIIGMADILHGAVGRRLTGLEVMECDHAMASAVVAGGARRSARMSVKHWADTDIFDFINCKKDPMKHWTTNISVEVDDDFFGALDAKDPHATAVMLAVVGGMYLNGEPGFYNSSLSSVGEVGDVRATNPCGEVPLEEGESCNIGSVDLDVFGTDDEGAEAAFRLMTRFLIRQTMTEMKTEISRAVESRNRRIGVGFLGLQGWAAAHGVKYSEIGTSTALYTKLTRFREAIRDEADTYCDQLGIPRCIKVTAIAPNGTIAQIRGTTPGAHATLARWYVRNVRYTTGDPRIEEARARNLKVEPCIYAENTWVVSYPVADPIVEEHPKDLIEQISEVSVWDQFAVLSAITHSFCGGTDGNAVSFTASFDPHDTSVENLYVAVRSWLPNCKGLTVFPTRSRPQSPYIPISEDEYWAMLRDAGALTGDTGDEELACSVGGACPIR